MASGANSTTPPIPDITTTAQSLVVGRIASKALATRTAAVSPTPMCITQKTSLGKNVRGAEDSGARSVKSRLSPAPAATIRDAKGRKTAID